VLVVDFSVSGTMKGLLARIHRRHGSVKLDDMIAMLKQAGLSIVESGAFGMKEMQFVLAMAP
jgi:hypothetical protein